MNSSASTLQGHLGRLGSKKSAVRAPNQAIAPPPEFEAVDNDVVAAPRKDRLSVPLVAWVERASSSSSNQSKKRLAPFSEILKRL